MRLSLYNKALININEPKNIYENIKNQLEKLNFKIFIFPENLTLFENVNNFFDSTDNFNELKIRNSVFNSEFLFKKIQNDHLVYLSELKTIYKHFFYDLSFYSNYRLFIENNQIEKLNNGFDSSILKYIFLKDEKFTKLGKLPVTLNLVSYFLLRKYSEQYVSSIKTNLYSSITKLNKELILTGFRNYININKQDIAINIKNMIVNKLLKLETDEISEEYETIILSFFQNKLNTISILFEEYINTYFNNYFFISLNSDIIEHFIEHLTIRLLNYPKELFYFETTYKITTPLNHEYIVNNYFYDKDNNRLEPIDQVVTDNIKITKTFDPDDDNDYLNLLRELNPDIDEFYKSYFVVEDQNIDGGGYINEIFKLEKMIFDLIKKVIISRNRELESIFYVSSQFNEDPLQFLNSNIYVFIKYVSDLINSKIFEQDFFSNFQLQALVKNIFIKNGNLFDFFTSYNFNKGISESKAIELSVYNSCSKLIFDFFDSDIFKKDFFKNDFYLMMEKFFPNFRDDVINNSDTVINNYKYILCKDIYNKKLFNNISLDYLEIYTTKANPSITSDMLVDIYENYLNNLDTEKYNILFKNTFLSFTYSLYLDIFLDNFRIIKKFKK